MTRERLRRAVPILGVLVLAWLIYRPLATLPVAVWDFREFLPILDAGSGIADRYRALLDYYAGHGRMNPLFYLTFVLQHAAFGADPIGWQVVRFAVMAIDLVLLWWFAGRLGADGWGRFVATALFAVATPVVGGWIQLMAEPLALLALLGAAHLALGYREAPRWPLRAAGIVGCLAVAFLCKEVVGVFGAVVVLLAVAGWPIPRVPAPVERTRVIALALAALLVALAVGAMILAVRSGPEATGYGMAYGSAGLSPARLWHNLVATTLPVRPEGRAALALLYPANLVLVALAMLGLHGWRPADARVRGWALGLGLLLPLLGALAYWPWPKFDAFYGLPFFVGPALLLGGAVTVLGARGGAAARWGRGAALVAVGYAVIPALRSVDAAAARLRLDQSAAAIIARLGPADTVLVLGPTASDRRLPVAAAELHDYAIATHLVAADRAPTVLDVPCERYAPGASPRYAYLSYSYGCGRFPEPGLRLASPYPWRDWLTLTPHVDTLAVDLDGAPIRALLQAP
ncbi:MAG: hypothetical protein KC544_05145 [Gemmatimonadetes bacterium]|nr:hypothetical protein [Gemmatimonadota bacterium]MCA9762500.1 hypothetical protein [Gemmatimonadota bacterium]MCB9504793.1 hypothetical protein [Gemmatimonadales bacterium]MCB9518813.1 hypothetical protein [Gemmatimonadales bacterium]HRX18968.1 hypothetical protein [Gemmatimonadales bacterium]